MDLHGEVFHGFRSHADSYCYQLGLGHYYLFIPHFVTF